MRMKGLEHKFWIYFLLTLFAIVLIVPFYYMIITSFKSMEEISGARISLIPKQPTFEPYKDLLVGSRFIHAAWNSLIIAVLLTIGNLILCPLAGYAFAKHRFPGKNALFLILLVTMMIPASVLLVPGFLLFRDLGWLNTWLPLIIPGLVGVFGVFLSRQFIYKIPDDLLDAARVDGCGEISIFANMIMPLSKPLLATLAIFTFLGSWNSFIGPMIVLLDEEKFTLPLIIALLQGRFVGKENIQMAGAMLSLLPILLVFIVFQKQVVQSLISSGLKE